MGEHHYSGTRRIRIFDFSQLLSFRLKKMKLILVYFQYISLYFKMLQLNSIIMMSCVSILNLIVFHKKNCKKKPILGYLKCIIITYRHIFFQMNFCPTSEEILCDKGDSHKCRNC